MAKKQSKSDQLFEKILKDRAARKEVVTKSLEWFFFVYLHNYVKYETAPFQEEIFGIAEDRNNKLAVIVAFRGSAKSTIITTAYSLWSILGVQQKKFIILLGQTEPKARQYLLNIKRELEGNQLLRRDLGPFDEEKNQWGATALVIRRFNAKIMIGSVEQSIRGLRHGEHRPDLIILDDVEDTNSVRNQEGRDKTFDWLAGEVIPAGDRNTRIIAIGNLLHEDSLLKRLQQKIQSGKMDGVYREYPIVDENGDPLWPGKYPAREHVEEERKKVASDAAWAREFLLKIIATDEQVVKPEWIKYYDELPPGANYYCATGIDLAISKDERADYTAMVSARIYGRRKSLAVYILPDSVNKRMTFLETINQAELVSDSLGKSKLFVEDVSYQAAAIEQLKNDGYPAMGAKVRGQDKFARLSAVSHLIQSGKVMFHKSGKILVNQLLGFGTEKYDDLADAFSILISKIIEEDNKPQSFAMCFKGPYNGEFDHLDPEERERMLNIRESMRKMFLL
ncbi:hypothetical protein EPN15_04920 [Patescibacteria group bacterium]|nr:MAG: hypothetical protein EPN15_04920 [Patescibacteria group bacterium]